MKWTDQGYWKSLLFYRQSVIYYWLLSAWYRSFTWYAAANPGISHAGMLNEKKSEIYPLLPSAFLPPTRFLDSREAALDFVRGMEFSFPIVIKPNIGLKGIAVEVCHDLKEAETYLQKSPRSEFIIQEYIDLPREFAVLFYRIGNKEIGISSFIEKKYPHVIGDGKLTLHQLIDQHPHPYLQKRRWKEYHRDIIIEKGQLKYIHSVGNYSQGASFHSLQGEIDNQLLNGILSCMDQIEGIDFCRLDVKAQSIEKLKAGDFKIIEVNGGKSEPLHIYDPTISFFQATRDIHQHWVKYTRVVNYHLSKGFRLLTTAEGVRALRQIKQVVKNKDK
ncbi:MAG: hypothetical protein KA340_11020 [Saprospiraceae bacterium]|jgi:hypothetical protein|nr:hypothetical protein [Saprospiraceae bacterium]